MNKFESVLDSIYCLSQEACSTITNLRAVPGIARDFNSCRLYALLESLHSAALEAFKTIELEWSEENLEEYFEDIFSIGSTIKETYEIFKITVELPCNPILLKKLEHQIEALFSVLLKLYKLAVHSKKHNEKYVVNGHRTIIEEPF